MKPNRLPIVLVLIVTVFFASSQCFAADPPAKPAKHAKSAGSAKTGSRIAMLLLGWLFFAIFWLFIASVAWYVLSMISFLLLLGLALVTHTPGFRDLFREALFRLKS